MFTEADALVKKLKVFAYERSLQQLHHMIMENNKPIPIPLNIKEQKYASNRVVKRLFFDVKGIEFGYVIASDVKECMICLKSLETKELKYLCCGCGIVVCSECCEEINEQDFACLQCSWGQDFVSLTPSYEFGLPVAVSNLDSYGKFDNVEAKPVLVISADRLCDKKKVLINLCESPIVPLNEKNLAPSDIMNKNLIFMVQGASFVTQDEMVVRTVTVNPEILENIGSFSVARDPVFVQLCEQVIEFVSRVTCEPLDLNFVVDHFTPFYDPALSFAENVKYHQNTKKNRRVRDLIDNARFSHQFVRVLIPSVEVFEKLYQVPIPSKKISVCTKSYSGKTVDEELSKKPSFVRKEKKKLSLNIDSFVSNFSDGSFSMDSKEKSAESIGTDESQDSPIDVAALSEYILSPLSIVKSKRLGAAKSASVKKLMEDSVADPSLLVGWQILLLNSKMEPKEKVTVLNTRKNLKRQTEFLVQYHENLETWVLLHRKEDKGGFFYRPLSKVF